MKLFFNLSIILFLNSSVLAREIILIEYIGNKSQAEKLYRTFLETRKIPEQLVHLEKVIKCQKKEETILQLCFTTEGKINVTNKRDLILKKAFRVFTQEEMMTNDEVEDV